MIIAIDYDGTVVSQDRPYSDVTTRPRLVPGAREALRALKAAGHRLLLWSGRASRALRVDPTWDPLARAGARPEADLRRWRSGRELAEARYRQMLRHVAEELPGLFDAVDDGAGGKPHADLFIDDRALRLGGAHGVSWQDVALEYGLNPGPEKAWRKSAAWAKVRGEQEKAPPYGDLLELWYAAARDEGAELEEAFATRVGPCLRLDARHAGADKATLLVLAGQHGEEQAGPWGLAAHARELLAQARLLGVRLVLWPCVNPLGYAMEERYTSGRPTNSFAEYWLGDDRGVEGTWRGDLDPATARLLGLDQVPPKCPRTRSPRSVSPENRAMQEELAHARNTACGYRWGLLDLHQDSMVPRGQCYAYTFGARKPYAQAMEAAGHKPMASTKLQNGSWTDVELATDGDGLVEFHDGSAPAWAWLEGAGLAACLEGPCMGPLREAADLAFRWAAAFVDALAAGELAR